MSRRIGGILFRHILREVGLACVGVAVVLLALLVTNQLAFVLGRVADGQVPGALVFDLLRLSVTENTGVILPISLLLGITIALGRLYHDSEMAAAQACGMGPRTVYAAVGLVTLVTAALAAWIAFVAGPDGARRSFEIRSESQRTALLRGLAPGQFRALGAGAVLYFRQQDAAGQLHDVFFERHLSRGSGGEEGHLEIVLADSAHYTLAADGSLAAVILQDGRRYEGLPGGGAWRTMRFREQTVPVRPPEGGSAKPRPDTQSTAALLASGDPRFGAEYHWRIASVVITLLLGLLAVPLARLRPRQGRYTRVIWGVLLYAVYASLLISGRTLLEKGAVPAWAGLWWVHALIAVLGLGIVKLPALADGLRRQRARRAVPAGV